MFVGALYKLVNNCPRWIVFLFLINLVLVSCSNIKYLKEDEELYTGADLNLESDEKIFKKFQLSRELESVITPTPNETLLGARPRLWFYNKFDTVAGKKGWRHYLKFKIGRPPVLYNSDIPVKTKKQLSGKLLSLGYLNASVNYEIKQKKKKVGLIYNVKLHKQYTIDTFVFKARNTVLDSKIKEALQLTTLKKGMPFKVENLEDERDRVGKYLKNEGFYYFSSDFLEFKVDSTTGNNSVKILIQTKPDTPTKASEKQTINNIYVYANYSLEKDSIFSRKEAILMKDGLYYIDAENQFKPKVICRTIFFEKGSTYRASNHDLTLKRLYELNIFKFINIQLKETAKDSANANSLDVYVYLTPYLPRSIRLEVEAISKSNSFMGPGISVDAQNRNFFRGAELLTLHLNGSFESQFFNKKNNLYYYEVGSDLSLNFPRFLLPFPVKFSLNQEIPHTNLSIGFKNLNRTGYYIVNTANASFGYKWNETSEKIHDIKPLNINYTNLGKTSAEFDSILKNNPSLEMSLQDQFIVGLTYSFQYSNQATHPNGNFFYLNPTLDVAGNILNLYSNTFGPQTEEPHEVLGLPYSQYVKVDVDFRYSLKVSNHSRLTTRFIAGVGLPYGNGDVLPYAKQFYIGGSNSIRAFRTRTLGPGSYKPKDDDVLFLDQTGDIKLEANVEYRFDLYKMLKGALFVDNGNIWLIKSDDKPEGVFDQNKFLKEIAVGTGLGIRLDVSFFVLRLDWAFPLRIPYNDEGERWVADKIQLGNKEWRSQNLILNIAIGYPF